MPFLHRPHGAASLAGVALAAAVAVVGLPARADETGIGTTEAHGQATWVWQHKPALRSPYAGANSLAAAPETSYSFTATAALGWQPRPGTELYLDPELARGVPLSGLTGLGGFSNGEIARSSGPTFKLYRARLFARQTWGFGGGTEAVASDFNQLAGEHDRRRATLTVGNLAVGDLFDANAYSHDPRTQFLNWSIMAMGAYDFAADARGYSTGVALEGWFDDWALRFGRFMLPERPNQQSLDIHLGSRYGDQLEVEHAHRFGERPGRVRLLLFHDRTRMARFDDALAAAPPGEPPSLDAVRGTVRDKWGLGLGLEQALAGGIGAFARASASDGHTEVYAFTEIDRSLSGGLLLDGGAWGRAGDSAGLAAASNGLSSAHRRYLEAGGLGFFIGDGRLRYRAEQVVEAFYAADLGQAVVLSLNAQVIRHPAYNADRGPARTLALRLHWSG